MKHHRDTHILDQQLQELELTGGGNGASAGLVSASNNLDRAWLLWENRRFLWRCTLCGLVLAAIFAFWLRKSYTSITRLMPPEREAMSTSPMAMMSAMSGNSSGGSAGSSLGDVASDLLGSKSQSALVATILEGRTVADALIQQFDLCKVYKVGYLADARARLKKHTEIAEDKKSGVIVIRVTDHDPHRAAQMAQAYVEALNNLLATVSTSSARRERIFIEGRLKTVKASLAAAEQQYSDYASKNTAIDIPEQGKAMVEAAAVLQGEMIAAQSELEGLSQIYTNSNVRVRSARARVAELQRQLEKMGGENPSLSSNVSGSGSSEMYPPIRKLPLLGVRWADLYRETKIEETVYELLTGEYELAKVQEAKEVPSVQVFDTADVPEKSSGPPRLLIMTIGAILAFGMSVVWILSKAAWQQVNSQDPRKELAEHVGNVTLGPIFQSAAWVRERVVKYLPAWPANGHATVKMEESKTPESE